MLNCEKCGIPGTEGIVKFSFVLGQYRCSKHDPYLSRQLSRSGVIVTRSVGRFKISESRENHLADQTLSPDDGETIISRSTGKEIDE